MQYVVLGIGRPGARERAPPSWQARFPKKLAVRIGYDEALAHRIEAGCDLFVMPSRFEPCGLNQLYSLRYGTPPIVRATGGLDDTIVDFDAALALRHRLQVRALRGGRARRLLAARPRRLPQRRPTSWRW